MWIASFLPQSPQNPETQNFLDLCLHLSPDVFVDSSGTRVLVSLKSVASYWQMGRVLSDPDNARHPFLQHLKLLREAQHRVQKSVDSARPSAFVLAPSPSLAAWGLEQERGNPELLAILNPIEIQKRFQELAPASLETLIEDRLGAKSETRKSWRRFLEDLEYLGIRDILSLKTLFQDPSLKKSCFERFPELAPLLLDRLILGGKDFSLRAHRPQDEMSAAFFPSLEDEMGSPSAQDLVVRIDEILRVWQLRLEARKSHLLGLEITLGFRRPFTRNRKTGRMETEITEHPLTLKFPQGLRNAVDLKALVREKLLSMPPEEARLFVLPLESVRLHSLGIERLNERQLSLFEQEHEASLEKWKILLGRLQARSHRGLEVLIGSFEANDTYWPEESFLWNTWKGNELDETTQPHPNPSFLEQPRRPLLFQEKPRPAYPHLKSLEDFLVFLRKENALHTLEHLTSAWGEEAQDRYYARTGNEWIFWDKRQHCAFIHGYFEEIPLAAS
jgi:hypothetical protein